MPKQFSGLGLNSGDPNANADLRSVVIRNQLQTPTTLCPQKLLFCNGFADYVRNPNKLNALFFESYC